MSFSYIEATDTLIATHTTVPSGASDQGTDTIRNVDSVVFLDRALDFSDFGQIRYSGSTPTTPAVLNGDEGGVPTRDFLFGGAGIDTINGLLLDDYIEGREGFDSINGGAGNDFLDGGPGRDFIDGGTGNDTAVYRAGDGVVSDYNRIDLGDDPSRRPFNPDETLLNIENLTGGDAMDWFWGDSGGNRLEGKDNNDKLVGLDGDDTLLGGDGYDQLVGGRGNDEMHAGQGRSILIGGWGDDLLTDADKQSWAWYGGVIWRSGATPMLRADRTLLTMPACRIWDLPLKK
ncbi:hypothetical protein N4R57_19980 [Rhodobacteraceae bacterium D3-12]|nr:hypothetical protein N4R57_19980 [Rhodobacteraceae bacterium D3-12]